MDVRDDGNAHAPVRLAVIGCLVGAWIAAGVLLWGADVPSLDVTAIDPTELFDSEFLERADDFRRGGRLFWIGEQVIQLAVLALLVWQARPVAAVIGRRIPGRVRLGVALAIGAVAAVWLAQLPVAAGRHAWRRRFDRTDQGYSAWLVDQVLSTVVLAVLVAAGVAVFVWLASRLGRRWWVPGGAILAACGAAFVLLQPLVIEPLFNDFRPLDDPELAAEIRAIGERLGVDVDEIEVRDQSRRTRSANAMASGVGPTTRVVIDDTLIDGSAFTRDEVLVVAAHELGHVAGHHVWKAVAWFALLAIPCVWVIARVTRARSPGGLADPPMVPLALLTLALFVTVTTPLQMAISRDFEREADFRALEATGDPQALEALLIGFATTNLGDPTRPEWVRQLLGTHPSTLDRIAVARAFAARAGPGTAGTG